MYDLFVTYRVTTCLKNLEMSGNLIALWKMSGKKSCRGKLLIVNFMFGAKPVFSNIVVCK